MNSFNHYAYGAIGDWMVHTVAGLDLDEKSPGYRHVVVHPQPGGGLTSARAELTTQYGSALSGWKLDGGTVEPRRARAPQHARHRATPACDARQRHRRRPRARGNGRRHGFDAEW